MVKSELRIQLQALLSNFSKETGITEEESNVIARTIITLVYSDKKTRYLWYVEMQKVSAMIAEILRDKADNIMNSLNMTDEEREKFKKEVSAKMKDDDKIDN